MKSTDEISTRDAALETVDSHAPVLDTLSALPDEIIQDSAKHLSELEKIELLSVSIRMHSLFQDQRLLDKFLQLVAFGQQDKAEQLFTVFYLDHPAKIQEALRYQDQFTDYSGRTFNCTAYEYAYWAKDTHMCRMLERYMDEETKARLLARINENDAAGLPYQQNGEEHRSAHFDFTPLKEAYQRYITHYDALSPQLQFADLERVWLDVGKAQRNVPAHVAQEYCRLDRTFDPRPEFNEATLPRMFVFFNFTTSVNNYWFPLAGSHSGLGFDFALSRSWGAQVRHGSSCIDQFQARIDLAAISRLEEVRTAELTPLLEHLKSPAASYRLSV